MIELVAATAITLSTQQTPEPRLDWWRDARFGMFIHWGLYSVPAGTWKESTRHAEWIRTTAQIPLETYDKFVDEFNPVLFDADEWCKMAADAGMGYVVITSKHHDGFCLFDSTQTDFDIMSTPFKRDIMKELAEAAPKHNVRMCWYHSIMDWHHPDYLPRRGWETERSSEGADMDRFREYLHAQVSELLTNYGPIGVMWFDGEWESTWRGEYGVELYQHCLQLQPDVIVNNRLGARGGMEGMTGMDGYAGGYGGDYATPEQEIPDAVEKGLDWETCMTMNDRWGYNIHDHNFKSTTDLLQKLSDIVSKNGNFLLNVGPKPDGTFPQESIDRLSEIGDWMDVNGEAIHGTIGSPFNKLPWGRATQKLHLDATTIYLHVFDWPSNGKLVIPGLAGKIIGVSVLGEGNATFTMEQGKVTVDVPLEMPNKHIGVIAIDVAGRPVVYEEPKIQAAAREFVHDLDVHISVGSSELEIRYTHADYQSTIEEIHLVHIYDGPIPISETTTIVAQCYDKGLPVSRKVSKQFKRVVPWDAQRVTITQRGKLQMDEYQGSWDELPDVSTLIPSGTTISVCINAVPETEYVCRIFTGHILIPEDDLYVFALTSDDGSRLLIDGIVVVDNDGLHGTQERRGTAPLAKGWHRIQVEWFNKTGGAVLDLRVGAIGSELKAIPSSSLAAK
jgi:alpha-L-fucosidase